MKDKGINEGILLMLVILPILFMALQWESLPNKMVKGYNLLGEPTGHMNKLSMLYTVGLCTILSYLLLLLIPKIDPRKRIQEMGSKYFSLRLIFQLLIGTILIIVVKASLNDQFEPIKYIYAFVLVFMIFLGNYLQSIKPNYFIGIRTPWALESESNWNCTHRWTGRLWIVGSIILSVTNWLIPTAFPILIGLGLLIITPVIYSFIYYKSNSKESMQ